MKLATTVQVSVDGPDRALDLVESRATLSGMTIQVYRLGGRPRYATD